MRGARGVGSFGDRHPAVVGDRSSALDGGAEATRPPMSSPSPLRGREREGGSDGVARAHSRKPGSGFLEKYAANQQDDYFSRSAVREKRCREQSPSAASIWRSKPVSLWTRRAAVLSLFAVGTTLVAGHTPYGQWQVYRQKHLLIGCHREDPETYDLAQQVVATLDERLPEAAARPARARTAGRLASLLGTDQLKLAVLSEEDAAAMAVGAGRFAPYGVYRIVAAWFGGGSGPGQPRRLSRRPRAAGDGRVASCGSRSRGAFSRARGAGLASRRGRRRFRAMSASRSRRYHASASTRGAEKLERRSGAAEIGYRRCVRESIPRRALAGSAQRPSPCWRDFEPHGLV